LAADGGTSTVSGGGVLGDVGIAAGCVVAGGLGSEPPAGTGVCALPEECWPAAAGWTP
jgi:hypothetical protein